MRLSSRVPANNSRISRRCLVSGRVQGVFYRATAAGKAREMGIDGYARNLPDGRVEVLASGAAQAVDAFTDWLWVGSSASQVAAVQVAEAETPPLQGFAAR
jgi:acylphosphatase